THSAESHFLDERDRLLCFIENLELRRYRARRVVQQARAHILRLEGAGAAITQVSDARRYEHHLGVARHAVPEQLNDELERTVEQRRVQVVLVEIVAQGVGNVQLREHGAAVDPAVSDRPERRTVVQADRARVHVVNGAGEIRLTGRQRTERAMQPDLRGFAQHPGYGVQGPGFLLDLLAGFDRELPIARIHRTAYGTARVVGEQQGCANLEIFDLRQAGGLPAQRGCQRQFQVTGTREHRHIPDHV